MLYANGNTHTHKSGKSGCNDSPADRFVVRSRVLHMPDTMAGVAAFTSEGVGAVSLCFFKLDFTFSASFLGMCVYVSFVFISLVLL